MKDKTQRSQPHMPFRHCLSVMRRLFRYMTEWHLRFYGMMLLLLILLGLEIVMPLVVESAINAISFSDGVSVDFRSLTFSIGLMIAIALLNAGAGYVMERISVKITLNASKRLRQDAMAALMGTGVDSFEHQRRGDLMSRISNDAEIAAGAFSETFRELVSCILMIVGCAVVMFVKCPSVAAVAVGAAILSVFLIATISRILFPAYTAQQAALAGLNHHVEESVKSFRTCKIGGRTEENIRRMNSFSHDYYSKRLRAGRLEYLMGPLMLLFGNLNLLLTVVFGAGQVISGAITLGAMQAFIMYSKQFMEPLSSVGEQTAHLQNALAGAERIFNIIDLKDESFVISEILKNENSCLAEHQIEDAVETQPLTDEINSSCDEPPELSFNDVSFAYHHNHPVLKNVSLKIAPGEKLALVGRTGVGKTTLTNLLLLFYPTYSGDIRINDRDIRTMSIDELRRMITFISQEPRIVDGTVYDNMVYSVEDVTPEEVDQTLREIGIGEIFSSLPQGLQSQMSSVEEHLSQGQLQLICLVRAVLRKSKILIMDEATSSIDPDTEQLLQRGMESALKGRTCILIAHRLSSVRNADHTAVIQDGQIAEYGTHESLMSEGGIYYSLYRKQFLGKET